ncbi:uncharacterized protein SCHCODRAFT_01169253 [Schizophyllum commune H4-8]|nr:uncharacterized protein SCHCODRAFT_01169253 [Schizophyllum commune H4-8]KAI5894638.1 hypothetical protein SCHCODRAFT_01169253 [Schizophyllum commune H4-8]
MFLARPTSARARSSDSGAPASPPFNSLGWPLDLSEPRVLGLAAVGVVSASLSSCAPALDKHILTACESIRIAHVQSALTSVLS